LRWAQIDSYITLHYVQELLESVITPGYPPESIDRALALHLQYLLFGSAHLSKEDAEVSEEKMFTLRPYVFAAHKVGHVYRSFSSTLLTVARITVRRLLGALDTVEVTRSVQRDTPDTTRHNCGERERIELNARSLPRRSILPLANVPNGALRPDSNVHSAYSLTRSSFDLLSARRARPCRDGSLASLFGR